MKHQFSSTIEILKKRETPTNLETGNKTVSYDIHFLNHVVQVSYNWLTRTLNKTGLDATKKGWLIDPRDIEVDVELGDTIQDYGTTSNTPKLIGVYEVVSIDIVDGGILVIGSRMLGADPRGVKTEYSSDSLALEDSG